METVLYMKTKLRAIIEKHIKPLEAEMLSQKITHDPFLNNARKTTLEKLDLLYVLLQEIDDLPERENPLDVRFPY